MSERWNADLGRTVRAELGQHAQAEAIPSMPEPQGGGARLLRWAWAGPLTLVAALALVWWMPHGASGPVPVAVGADLQAGLHVFEDGSQLRALGGSAIAVLRAEPTGAEVRVKRGEVHFDVRHLPGASTAWTVRAGEHRVTVVGTRFTLRWQPDDQVFDLKMEEGTVRLAGPAGARTVTAPEEVRWPENAGSETPAPAARPAEPVTPPADEEESELDPADARVAAVRRQPSKGGTGTMAPGTAWRALAKQGDYPAALKAARARGFARIWAKGSESDLLLLADVARWGKEPEVARTTLTKIRGRFTGQVAAEAAFALGKLEAREGRRNAAVKWFGAYLEELPRGSLAPEALARRMQLQQALGDAVAARRDAKLYLKRHPSGPAAAEARAMLSAR